MELTAEVAKQLSKHKGVLEEGKGVLMSYDLEQAELMKEDWEQKGEWASSWKELKEEADKTAGEFLQQYEALQKKWAEGAPTTADECSRLLKEVKGSESDKELADLGKKLKQHLQKMKTMLSNAATLLARRQVASDLKQPTPKKAKTGQALLGI